MRWADAHCPRRLCLNADGFVRARLCLFTLCVSLAKTCLKRVLQIVSGELQLLVAAQVVVAAFFDLRGTGATEHVVVGASERWPFAGGGRRLEAYWTVLFIIIHLLWMRYLSDHF